MSETALTEPRCIRADRCADASTVDGVRVGATVNTSAGLCVADERHVRGAIAGLPEVYVRLNLQLGRATSGAAEYGSGTPELPVPLRLDIEGLQREIVSEATRWAEPVAEAARLPWDTQNARDSRPGPLLQHACSLLADHLPVLLALRDVAQVVFDEHHHRTVLERDGVDDGLRLLDLHGRAGRVLAIDRRVYRLPEPCPACGVAALEHADGSDQVSCTACGTWLTWSAYKQRTDPLAALEEAS